MTSDEGFLVAPQQQEGTFYWLCTRAYPNPSSSTSSEEASTRGSRFSNLYLRLHGDGINAVMLTPSPPKFLRAHPIVGRGPAGEETLVVRSRPKSQEQLEAGQDLLTGRDEEAAEPDRGSTASEDTTAAGDEITMKNTIPPSPLPPQKDPSVIIGAQNLTSWKSLHLGRTFTLSLASGQDGNCKGGWCPAEIVETTEKEEEEEEEEEEETARVGGFCWGTDADNNTICDKQETQQAETLRFAGKTKQGVDWKGWMACNWAYGHPQLFWFTGNFKGELPDECERVVLVKEGTDGLGNKLQGE